MAIPIKQVPVLTGVPALRFIKHAMESYKNRGGVDFSEQAEIAKRILIKSNLVRVNPSEHRCSAYKYLIP